MMKIRLAIWFLVIASLVGCSSNYIVELQNGYKIWFMSATKVYIGNHEDSLVVGPNVEGLYAKDHYIVGIVDNSDVGYFVIDTVKNTVKKNLSKKIWKTELLAIGLSKDISLVPPTTNFKIHHD